MAYQTKRRRRRKLRWQFVVFCAVVVLLLAGIVFLATRCVSRHAAKKQQETEPPAPEEVAEEVLIPEGYVAIDGDIHSGSLILVSNDHPYSLPVDAELTAVWEKTGDDYTVRDYTIKLLPEAADAFDALFEAFAAATGKKDVNITSAYRSVEEQQEVYDDAVAKDGIEHTQRFVSQPGCSEHHTGLAVDLNVYNTRTGACYDFDGTGDYKWIPSRCAKYGIILRYPAEKEEITGIGGETWHFRYVGVPHASYMVEHDLCLEEYIDLLREHTVGEAIYYGDYMIYYCPANALCVPEGSTYTVSGNNVDGFIVTVE